MPLRYLLVKSVEQLHWRSGFEKPPAKELRDGAIRQLFCHSTAAVSGLNLVGDLRPESLRTPLQSAQMLIDRRHHLAIDRIRLLSALQRQVHCPLDFVQLFACASQDLIEFGEDIGGGAKMTLPIAHVQL